ncbi:MAG: hypothetical protein EAZ99_06825 [Alphaproteobacteria bacterium]|nr:MAG: hypothetical protein EAZ99_06825 [Alphaproteobacteria bacterium]
MVAGDTNGAHDVFVRDTGAGTTVRVSVATNGTQGNGSTYLTGFSASGNHIAMISSASTLVAGDTNGKDDGFVHNRLTGETTRISVSTAGAEADANTVGVPAISKDGRYVVFLSAATNLVAGDTNGATDVFVRDTQANTTIRVSVATDGTQHNGNVEYADMSQDGRFIVFGSTATNLVAGDTNGVPDVFLHDRDTDGNGVLDEAGRVATIRVSTSTTGTQGNAASAVPILSPDGRFLVFNSQASNLVAGDGAGTSELFRVSLAATSAADEIHGSPARDRLTGEDGADTLQGFAGIDTLVGGAGEDVFLWSTHFTDTDVISDPNPGDAIRVDGVAITSLGNGTGAGLLTGGIHWSVTGGITTLFLGIDGTPGFDRSLELTGAFTAEQLVVSGNQVQLRAQSVTPPPEPVRVTAAADGSGLDGGSQNDTLIGATGHDWMAGRAGNDLLIGNRGMDVAQYDSLDPASVTVRIFGRHAEVTSAREGTDRLLSIEALAQASHRIMSLSALPDAESRDSTPSAQIEVIRRGFDANFYLLANSDVLTALTQRGGDTLTTPALIDGALQHWQQFGWREGRDPNTLFSTIDYLARNPDVRAQGIDPLEHWISYGASEGRGLARFNAASYLAQNPDVRLAGANALEHALFFGFAEGRTLPL